MVARAHLPPLIRTPTSCVFIHDSDGSSIANKHTSGSASNFAPGHRFHWEQNIWFSRVCTDRHFMAAATTVSLPHCTYTHKYYLSSYWSRHRFCWSHSITPWTYRIFTYFSNWIQFEMLICETSYVDINLTTKESFVERPRIIFCSSAALLGLKSGLKLCIKM